jgi:hypothetical protein
MVSELSHLRQSLKNPNRPKAVKESILRSIRRLERALDLEHVPYNKR